MLRTVAEAFVKQNEIDKMVDEVRYKYISEDVESYAKWLILMQQVSTHKQLKYEWTW